MHIAIDLWDKHCGLAIELEGVVIPKSIVPRTQLVRELKKMCTEYRVHTIIVGAAYHVSGEKSRQFQKAEIFCKKLRDIFPKISIEMVDERFTTFQAQYITSMMWEKAKRDDIAAACILESGLKRKNMFEKEL